MPTKRQVQSRKRYRLPTPADPRPVPFECWQQHRRTLMAWSHKGHRPPEWWLYEKGMDCPDNEEAVLYAMGELSRSELAEVMAFWREQYERTLDPGFMYCIGCKPGEVYATWLDGLPARRAQLRWAGIPMVVISGWNAERRGARSASARGRGDDDV